MVTRKKKRSSGILGAVLIGGFLLLTTGGLWIPLVIHVFFEKDYSFPAVEIDATVQQNGDLTVVEERTFNFRNGPFTYAYFNVEEPEERVRDFTISEVMPDGTERELEWCCGHTIIGPKFEARWDYSTPADGEQRTFIVRYTYRCAVDVYRDTAHLNYWFIGEGWEKPTGAASITVHLPEVAPADEAIEQVPLGRQIERFGGAEPGCDEPMQVEPIAGRPLEAGEVKAFGHGPLNGDVALPNPQTVTFDVTDVAPGMFVEASIVFPREAVPFARIGTGHNRETVSGLIPDDPGPQRDNILAAEAEWAAEADAVRAAAATQQRVLTWLVVIVPLGLAAAVVLSRFRDRVPGVPREISEPPEDDAVDAAFVWSKFRGGSVANAYRAQLLRLIRLGAIELRVEGLVSDPDDLILIKRKGPEEMSDESDRDFLSFLFGRATDVEAVDEISMSTPRMRDTSNPVRFNTWLRSAKEEVEHPMLTIEKGDARLESMGAAALALGAASFGVWTAIWGWLGSAGWWLLPYWLILLFVALRLIPARVEPALRERLARLIAFRRYLTHFSDLPNAPAAAIVIWEHYLEWAAALNCADEVESQIKAALPGQDLPATLGMAPGTDPFPVMRTLATGTTALVMSASAGPSVSTSGGIGSSSSSGGGGGFSSGGGGGGGGGGTGGGAG